MVRTYSRVPGSRPYANFKKEDLEKALAAVAAGMPKKRAALTYKIPRTTLVRKVVGKNPKPVGHPTVLSRQEEATISATLGTVANWGYPLTRADVRDVIKKYLDKQGKTVAVFHENTPGPDFLDSFIKRNRLSI